MVRALPSSTITAYAKLGKFARVAQSQRVLQVVQTVGQTVASSRREETKKRTLARFFCFGRLSLIARFFPDFRSFRSIVRDVSECFRAILRFLRKIWKIRKFRDIEFQKESNRNKIVGMRRKLKERKKKWA